MFKLFVDIQLYEAKNTLFSILLQHRFEINFFCSYIYIHIIYMCMKKQTYSLQWHSNPDITRYRDTDHPPRCPKSSSWIGDK